jgi:hypothetical protein
MGGRQNGNEWRRINGGGRWGRVLPFRVVSVGSGWTRTCLLARFPNTTGTPSILYAGGNNLPMAYQIVWALVVFVGMDCDLGIPAHLLFSVLAVTLGL